MRFGQMAQELTVLAEEVAKPDAPVPAFRRDEEGYATVTFKVKGDALHALLRLVKQCEYLGNVGHTFTIVVDPKGGKDFKREVGFDGDGADRVKDIHVNGEPLSDKFE